MAKGVSSAFLLHCASTVTALYVFTELHCGVSRATEMTQEKEQDLTTGTEGRKTTPLNHSILLNWLNYLLKSHPQECDKAEI